MRLAELQDHYENLYAVIRGTKTFTLKPPCCVHQMHLGEYETYQEHMDPDTLSFQTELMASAVPIRWCPIDLSTIQASEQTQSARDVRPAAHGSEADASQRMHPQLSKQTDAPEQTAGKGCTGAAALEACSGEHETDGEPFRAFCPFNAAFAASCDPAGDATALPVEVSSKSARSGGYPRFRERPRPLRVTVHAGDVLYLPAMWYHAVEQDEGDADAVIAANWWFDMRFDDRFAQHQLLDNLSRHL